MLLWSLPTAPAQAIYIDFQEAEEQASETERQDMEAERQTVEAEQQAMEAEQQTMELQWKSYVMNLKASGTLSSALAVCDVSGSMTGQPMQVSQAWAQSQVYLLAATSVLAASISAW